MGEIAAGVAACCLLAACGSTVSSFGINVASNNSGGSNTVSDGVYRDAVVGGLHYVSGPNEGTTSNAGVFKFQPGQSVTFSIGGVTLGSASGAIASVTPLQFFQNGTINTPGVINMVRFLILLDSDGDPSNGFTISPGVQEKAANWAQIDFTVPQEDFAAALIGANIVSDVSTADSWATVPRLWQDANGTPLIPDASFAQSHIRNTLTCLQSGIFQGQISGEQAGIVGLYIDPKSGLVNGFVRYNDNTSVLMALSGSSPVDFGTHPPTVSGVTNLSRFNISFTNLDQIDGTTTSSDFNSQTSGTLSGGRAGGELQAVIRISGHHTQSGKDAGVFTLDIEAAGSGNQQVVNGKVYDMLTNTTADVSGFLTAGTDAGTADVSFGDGDRVFTGTLNYITATISGIWNAGNGNTAFGGSDITTGTFDGTGCGL